MTRSQFLPKRGYMRQVIAGVVVRARNAWMADFEIMLSSTISTNGAKNRYASRSLSGVGACVGLSNIVVFGGCSVTRKVCYLGAG